MAGWKKDQICIERGVGDAAQLEVAMADSKDGENPPLRRRIGLTPDGKVFADIIGDNSPAVTDPEEVVRQLGIILKNA